MRLIVGAYSLSNSVFDVGIMLGFGLLGYAMKKLDFPLAPMVLTLILGPLMERALRHTLEISERELSILVTRPISAALLAIAVIIVLTFSLRVFSQVRGGEVEV